jgi:hypothetical protein
MALKADSSVPHCNSPERNEYFLKLNKGPLYYQGCTECEEVRKADIISGLNFSVIHIYLFISTNQYKLRMWKLPWGKTKSTYIISQDYITVMERTRQIDRMYHHSPAASRDSASATAASASISELSSLLA